MRTRTRLLLAALVTTCVVGPASAAPIQIRSSVVPLHPAKPTLDRVGSMRWLTGLHLQSDDRRFGGISGFEFHDGQLIAVSDRGFWLILKVQRDSRGVVAAIASGEVYPLLSPNGVALEGRRADAEEVVIRPDGGVFLTFEHDHRLAEFGVLRGAGRRFAQARERALPPLPGMSECPDNGGLEAATWHPTLGFIALQEHARKGTTVHPGWTWHGGKDRRFNYRGVAPYRPTGMTHLGNGDLVTIERYYSKATGPISRVVRISLDAIQARAPIVSGTDLGRFDGELTRDNFEAIAAAPLRDGSASVLVASDDNYASHQRTLLVQLALPARE